MHNPNNQESEGRAHKQDSIIHPSPMDTPNKMNTFLNRHSEGRHILSERPSPKIWQRGSAKIQSRYSLTNYSAHSPAPVDFRIRSSFKDALTNSQLRTENNNRTNTQHNLIYLNPSNQHQIQSAAGIQKSARIQEQEVDLNMSQRSDNSHRSSLEREQKYPKLLLEGSERKSLGSQSHRSRTSEHSIWEPERSNVIEQINEAEENDVVAPKTTRNRTNPPDFIDQMVMGVIEPYLRSSAKGSSTIHPHEQTIEERTVTNQDTNQVVSVGHSFQHSLSVTKTDDEEDPVKFYSHRAPQRDKTKIFQTGLEDLEEASKSCSSVSAHEKLLEKALDYEQIKNNYHGIVYRSACYYKNESHIDHTDDEMFESLANNHVETRYMPKPKTEIGERLLKNGLFLLALIKLLVSKSGVIEPDRDPATFKQELYQLFLNTFSINSNREDFLLAYRLNKTEADMAWRNMVQKSLASSGNRSAEPLKRQSHEENGKSKSRVKSNRKTQVLSGGGNRQSQRKSKKLQIAEISNMSQPNRDTGKDPVPQNIVNIPLKLKQLIDPDLCHMGVYSLYKAEKNNQYQPLEQFVLVALPRRHQASNEDLRQVIETARVLCDSDNLFFIDLVTANESCERE